MTYHADYYPLTHPQKGIWYTEKLHPHTSIGNIAGSVRIREEIDYCCLEKAINILIQKNDSIRIRISEEESEPVQYISEYNYTSIDFLDFSKKGLKELYKWDEQQTTTPFDIEGSDLFYFALLKISDTEGGFYFKLHHLISDAWTASLIINQIIEYYWRLKNKIEISAENKPSYTEYINREENYKNSKKFIKDKDFWNSILSDIPEITSLKTSNNALKSTRSKRKAFVIPPELASQVREYCAGNKVSPFTFFLSILAVYINRIALKSDIVLGTPVLNRSNTREKNMLGMFVSTIPLRFSVDESMDFSSLVQTLAKEWMMTLRHYEYPYDLLIKDIREKHRSVENLYDIVLSYQNAKLNKAEYISNYEARWHFNGHQTNSLSIHINERENDGNIAFDYDYLAQVFTLKSIEYIHKHMLVIIQDAMKNPSKKIYQLEILEEEEKKRILCDFNNTSAEYPKDKTIHQLFEEQVERTPDNIAVVFEDKQLTYRELNGKANQLARILREKGVGPDSIVGIMTGRSLEMIIGIMGVLKAGGAYLPIDPDYPEERIKYMLDDSNARLLLTQSNNSKRVSFEGDIIYIDSEDIYKEYDFNITNVNKPCDLAYVIYTSGSTGKPKGVMLEHKSVNNFIKGIKDRIDFSPGKTILSVTTISFDIFVLETLLPLASGLKIVIANESEQNTPKLLNQVILKNEVNMVQTTPSRMQLLLSDDNSVDCLRNLSELMIGGEAFPELLLENLKNLTNARIYNMYGPTETTVWSTVKELNDSIKVDIGRPIANTWIYILDNHMNPVPIGVAGEMYIGGDGLARGYFNKPELTSERFVENPFIHGEKIYKTGDLARWFPKGEIEHLGRIDCQVKIRGFRIEPGEIEKKLLCYESIRGAVVIDKEDKTGTKYLCAYIVSDEDLPVPDLRRFLAGELPNYMIPHCFIKIERIPLTPNGKVDRKALPEFNGYIKAETEYRASRTETEKKLMEIWNDILSIERIGIDDNFFELGGDSLNIVSLVTRIHREFNVELPLERIYKSPNIKEIGEFIENTKKNVFLPIQPIRKQEYYKASAAQKRLYLLMQIEGNKTAYNMPWAMLVEGNLDKEKIENAIKFLVNRHESLRTAFELVGGELVQRIYNNIDFQINYSKTAEYKLKNMINEFIQPFDLSKAPLLRVKIIQLSEEKYILLFDMHHIISDGASANILLDELANLYEGRALTKLRLQYKDYSEWQNELLKSEAMKRQEEFWLSVFSGDIPALNMPIDSPRPPIQCFEGESVRFKIGKVMADKLNKLALKTGTTLYMLLLAVYNILLSKYTGQEDIIVGSPLAGRNHSDLENIVGMFVNTVAIRNLPEDQKTFVEFLEDVKENSLKVYANQDYPFEELVSKLRIKRDLSRNPLFDTMFVFQNKDAMNMKISGLKIRPYELENRVSKFDFTLEAVENYNGINFNLEYCTKLFRRETVERMAGHFINILNVVQDNPSIKISQINMLSQNEVSRILHEFNNTRKDYQRDKTVHQLFEEQVERAPDNIAIVFEDRKITYRELNEKSNQLARILREKGVMPESKIGIMTHRSVEMVIGMMGTLKAGGAYIPIDPNYPSDRIKFMLEDSNSKILLTQGSIKGAGFGKCKIIDLFDEDTYSGDTYNLTNICNPDNLIYVIYTSGSTGRPKGTLLTHKSINNFISAASEHINFSDKTVLSKTTMCFDIFAFETLLPLVKGLKIILTNEEQQRIPRLLNELIIENNANITITTPSTLQLLSDDELGHVALKKLTDIIIGGEVLSETFLERLEGITFAKIYNAYGPTETTVYSTIKELNNAAKISIGKPIANTRAYILDRNLKVLPVGVAGELCIGGDGVARAYLNKSELTDEKFVNFSLILGERIYRTGDLARWLSSGEIEFIGRMDQQIKIRGIRIEPDEITNVLLSHGLVNEAVVIDRNGENGIKYLCAYFVPKSGESITTVELRRFLSEKLPDYMVPTYFVKLESIPLTPNGKVDRELLPRPQRQLGEEIDFELPRNEIDKKLIEIWSQVLNLDPGKISISHNFFELGGDSLSIIQVQTKILHYNWDLVTQDFYRYQTIKKLSDKVCGMDESYDNTEKVKLESFVKSIQEEAAACLETFGDEDSFDNILLTGATGFLGIHILNEILCSTDAKVYCLIRGDSNHKSIERLQKLFDYYFSGRHKELLGKRVFVLDGDIILDNLGLKENEYMDLGQKIDVVVHAAATVKHFGDYSEFKKVNVSGTQNVVDFVRENKIMLFHISTMSVSGDYIVEYSKSKNKFTENDLYIGQNYADSVYVRSKFEAENLVCKAMDSGLKAAILRIGNLTGRYSDGCFQINMHENAFYNILVSIIKLGAISSELLKKGIEFTPVDCCSEAIVDILSTSHTDNLSGRVFHLYNHNFISFEKIIEILKEQGVNIKVMDKFSFENYIINISKDGSKQNILKGLIPNLDIQNHHTNKLYVTVDSKITQGYLRQIGFRWPDINEVYLNSILKFIWDNWKSWD